MSEPSSCFHCHLPVPKDADWHLEVLDQPRDFCCAGCYSVCKTIVDNGMQAYYEHREEPASPSDLVPDFLKQAKLYDHPDVQKGFVRRNAESCQADLVLEGIRCASCVWLNEQQLRQQPGILSVEADYVSQRMQVEWDPKQIQLSAILEAIVAVGYLAHPYDPAHREALQRDQKTRNSNRILFAAAIGMPVMQFSLASYFMGVESLTALPLWVEIGRWVMLLAVTAILAYPGQEFFLGAWRDLKNQRLGMDVPIIFGLSIAWMSTAWAVITGQGEVYFDSISMFVLFLLIARAYELKGRRTAASLLDRLHAVIPQQIYVASEAGLVLRPVVELQAGDIIELRVGDTCPIDGELVAGQSGFDESVLSGESLPVDKSLGDSIVAGSRNLTQTVRVRVQRVGPQTSLSEIQSLMQSGLSKANSTRLLADRVVTWFVPAILMLASVSLFFWLFRDPSQAISNTVAILIVSCPCALALATPVVNVIAAGRFAEQGMVPIRMGAMETLAQVRSAVLDKTGTLTNGQFVLQGCLTAADAEADYAAAIAANLERGNPHPLARAFTTEQHWDLDEVQQVHSKGVKGRLGHTSWRLGKPEFALPGLQLPDSWQQTIAANEQQAQHCLILAKDEQPYALFVLADEMRAGAESLVTDLRKLGIHQQAIISGDRPAAVQAMQQRLDIANAQGGMSPQDKLAWMERDSGCPKPRLMIGDGVNDAPTLGAAEVSFSFAEANTLAQTQSDFVILGHSLTPVSQAVQLSRMMRRLIKQNYAWAIGYNLIAIPLAFAGFIPPWAAALGMSLSSLIVVSNSLRLGRYRVAS